eukprot:GHRR01011322.1.p3 GENE.GHRR01011322.1~~GHRR01011322.1.p3  ORF type:complete len:128 (+),score=42.95 GHRR01011322.1:163-546(+)
MADQKDLQAFRELQDKLNVNTGFAQAVQQQLQRAKISVKRSQLTLEELSSMSSEVPMYRQVGKAYFLAPAQQVITDLKQDIQASEEEAQRLTQQQEHATKAIIATEGELRELMKSHPEIVKQLAAMA